MKRSLEGPGAWCRNREAAFATYSGGCFDSFLLGGGSHLSGVMWIETGTMGL